MIIKEVTNMASFNERLFELRHQRDLSQAELAQYVGLNKQTISQYERGVRRPDLDILSILCDFFNVSTDYILGKSNVTIRYVDSSDLEKLCITDTERDLVIAYRRAPESRREAVRALLDIKEKEAESSAS